MIGEAKLEQAPSGLLPAGAGWFVVNVRDTAWATNDRLGAGCRFENTDQPFPELGINLRVLQPGQSNAMYHRESSQEDFLVLAGKCRLLVEGQERELGAWDFVHCPPNTEHVFIGAGTGPCVILMAGARDPDNEVFYPVSGLARRYGAGVEKATSSPPEAYANAPAFRAERPPDWEKLPWA
ncbi:MAG: cupin domain-containing protein [Gaiellaceae bacterium]|jgi:uncharacterized cupin superfamily protein